MRIQFTQEICSLYCVYR